MTCIALNLAAIAAIGLVAACNSDAGGTYEEAAKKSADLTAKVQELAAAAAGTGDDLATACKAMDEMMTELSK